MRISRIDKYLLSQLSRTAFIYTFVSVIVLLALQALRLSGLIVGQDLDIFLVLRMTAGLALSFVTIVIPISFVFAQLNVFGQMSSEKEFVAMQAMGHSPYKLMRTCAAFGLFMASLSLWSSLSLSPYGNRIFEASVNEAYKKKVASVLRSGTFSEDFLDTVLFAENVNASTNELDHVFMYDEKGLGPKSVISAKKGLWKVSQETGLGVLTLKNGVILSEEASRNSVRRIKFDQYKVNSDFSRREGSSKDSPPSLGFYDLVSRIKNIKKNPSAQKPTELRNLWAELARRFAVSLVCLLLTPLCFGLSISNKRTAKNQSIMMGILILFTYWTLYFAFTTWYLKAKIPIFNTQQIFAWIILWIPNAIAIFLGYILMRRKSKLAS